MDDVEMEKQIELAQREIQGIIYKYPPYASLTALLTIATTGLVCTGAPDEVLLELVRNLLQQTRELHIGALDSLPDSPIADLIRRAAGKVDKFDE